MRGRPTEATISTAVPTAAANSLSRDSSGASAPALAATSFRSGESSRARPCRARDCWMPCSSTPGRRGAISIFKCREGVFLLELPNSSNSNRGFQPHTYSGTPGKSRHTTTVHNRCRTIAAISSSTSHTGLLFMLLLRALITMAGISASPTPKWDSRGSCSDSVQ